MTASPVNIRVTQSLDRIPTTIAELESTLNAKVGALKHMHMQVPDVCLVVAAADKTTAQLIVLTGAHRGSRVADDDGVAQQSGASRTTAVIV